MDIEKYDNLSHKLGMSFEESPTKPHVVRKNYQYYKGRKIWKAIKRVVPSLVGKGWDEAYAILTRVYNNVNTDLDKKYVISACIHTFTGNGAGNLVSSGKYRSVKEYESIKDFIEEQQRPSLYTNKVYYVDPNTNRVCVVENKRKPSRPSYKESRKIQEKTSKVKLQRKEEIKNRAKIEESLINMINKPDLYKFYRELVDQKKILLGIIHKSPYPEPVLKLYETDYSLTKKVGRLWKRVRVAIPFHKAEEKLKKDMKSWRYSERARIREVSRAKEELPKIQEQIDHLEAGRYDVFFESNVYLYSVQKECHHVAQP